LGRIFEVDRLCDGAFHRFEGHYASLPNPGSDLACDRNGSPLTNEIKSGRKPQHLIDSSKFRQLAADRTRGLYFHVQAGFRDILDGYRHAPTFTIIFH
jgi:hypothetical protein